MFKRQDLHMFSLKLDKLVIFQPLEVVGRSSETQLLLGENLNHFIFCFT